MNSLKNFTIRRVVLWILLTSMALITATGGYTAFTAHEMKKHADQNAELTQQAIFLARASMVLQQGTDAEKKKLLNEIPSDAGWTPISQALSGTSPAWIPEITALAAALTQQSHTASTQIASEQYWLNVVLVAGLMAAGALVLFCDIYLVVHLVKPVEDVRAHFLILADGDLTHEPKEHGRNCIGQMIPLLREMQHSLLTTVRAISVNTDSLHREATEIAEGNTDLADRTTQQAAALEQTAASMEELTATVNHNAANARQARDLSVMTAQTTGKASVLVDNLAGTMKRIAQGAEQIRQFTSTINSIAFQTNILALNAAVEAARAGDQGRGFAVVASEVRSLAQRSAAAASEIETLINSAITSVHEGSMVVEATGGAMTEVNSNVTSVNELIGQIAMASDEQSQGISQITHTVAELDQVTQRNAEMVNQITASARNLHSRAETLRGVVNQFTLPAFTPRAQGPATEGDARLIPTLAQ